ncbi:SRPBCC domain-containing protein [Streptomyces cylindrosporus]|uniref:Carbon monoxide dehydrogenase n=1 Tax=Streptomyces cylindrosporus TaxID=2927583 RepID=A0ABS9YJR4_9ACTN|nr:SRPBCC domain-containing protein [Streptomyces cylindrosporus]MCI3276820.1 carbon monoxide dehydrogenase [Streptomyces cylindrosporus]
MISIKEEIAVPSPPDRVWEVISDPSAVVSCIGGAELGASHDDGSFDGALAVRFGGLRVKFAARVALDLDEPEHEGRLTARGADGQGATRFSAGATFRVAEGQTPGSSRVFCDGEIKLNGKLAKLIESGASMVVARMTKEFTDELVKACAATAEPVAAAAGSPAPAPSDASAAVSRPTGLIARLRAWWAGRRARRQGQSPHPPTPSAGASAETLGQVGQGSRR